MRVKLPPKKFEQRLLQNQQGIACNSLDAAFAQEALVQEQVEWTLFYGRWKWRLRLWYRFGKALQAWFDQNIKPRFWTLMRRIERWTDRQLGKCTKYIDDDSK